MANVGWTLKSPLNFYIIAWFEWKLSTNCNLHDRVVKIQFGTSRISLLPNRWTNKFEATWTEVYGLWVEVHCAGVHFVVIYRKLEKFSAAHFRGKLFLQIDTQSKENYSQKVYCSQYVAETFTSKLTSDMRWWHQLWIKFPRTLYIIDNFVISFVEC